MSLESSQILFDNVPVLTSTNFAHLQLMDQLSVSIRMDQTIGFPSQLLAELDLFYLSMHHHPLSSESLLVNQAQVLLENQTLMELYSLTSFA